MVTFEKNFLTLCKNKMIRVPGIQRDYAEGRRTTRVNEIRRLFLNDLLKVIYSPSGDRLHLDFVYGYDRDGAFEPLDGQQRLTTLFLLHWFFCPENFKNDLILNGKAVLSYATRQSTIDFCNELVCHSASEICKKKSAYCKQKEELPLSLFLMKEGWFKWQWRYDPSILSMLVVIEEIDNLIIQNKYQDPHYENLKNISFHLLNLDEFDMGDELYVKMNARGKQLSSFDIMKSVLEEEMQIQGLSGSETEKQWRTQIDGLWINYFWQNYCKDKNINDIPNIAYDDVEGKVEMQLKRLIQRIICVQFYNRVDVDYELWMIGKQLDFENVLPMYCDLAWKRRTIERKVNFPEKLDFESLITDINNLFYIDGGQIHNASDFLNILWLPEKSLWDEYLKDPEKDLQVAFFAMILFLRTYSATELLNKDELIKEFNDWMRFIRNTVLLRNTQQQIDKSEKERKAIEAIENIWKKYRTQNSSMREFLSNLDNISGLANVSLEEERIKSSVQLADSNWLEEIENLENNTYLWGQIIAPLQWSMQPSGKPVFALFKSYAEKLQKIFPISDEYKLRAALLCVENYGNWKKSAEDLYLCENYFNRDRSFKNFLRSQESSYGEVIKKLIDLWYAEFADCVTFDELFEELRKRFEPQDWRKHIVRNPSILEFASNSKLWYDTNTEHMFLRQKLQSDTQHREIFLAYLWSQIDQDKAIILDWYPENGNSNTLSISTNNICIGLTNGGKYLYSDKNCSQQVLADEAIIEKLQSLHIMK